MQLSVRTACALPIYHASSKAYRHEKPLYGVPKALQRPLSPLSIPRIYYNATDISHIVSEEYGMALKSKGMQAGSFKRVDDQDLALSTSETLSLASAALRVGCQDFPPQQRTSILYL